MFVTTLKRNVGCAHDASEVPVWSVYLFPFPFAHVQYGVSGKHAVSHLSLTYQKAHVCLPLVLHCSNDRMYFLNAKI